MRARAAILAAMAWIALAVSPAWARATAGAGVAGSAHDFTKPGKQNDGSADRCIFCHVGRNGSPSSDYQPLNHTPPTSTWMARAGTRKAQASDAFDNLPLWNPELANNKSFYTMYENGRGAPQSGAKSSQANAGKRTPGSTSLLCLSCHDGSLAINSYGNDSPLGGSGEGITVGPQYIIGKGGYLGNHHPVGFDYDAVRSEDKEIRSADTSKLGSAGTVRDHLYGESNTRMECGTCHSVHNTGNTGEALLWRSDANSRLCLTCHDKGTNPYAMVP